MSQTPHVEFCTGKNALPSPSFEEPPKEIKNQFLIERFAFDWDIIDM